MRDKQDPTPPQAVLDAIAEDGRLTITLEPELVAAIDRYAREKGLDGARSEWARAALRDWALSRNYLSASQEEGKRPGELDASNDD